MQTVITAVAKSGASLRDAIVNDPNLGEFNLRVVAKKNPERAHGWAKLNSANVDGAINIQWLAHSRILLCRVVTRDRAQPGPITGYLIDYLLTRQHRRIIHLQISRA
jgi:hypothetical protein